ncbi:MAG TPA: hypothetical protein VKD91_10035, partial [Pyrinomonadaceae bacterium]|nr:hypothetical protein [Pyrinomonadaceae bacterium]
MISKRFAPLGWLLCFCMVVFGQSSSLTESEKKSGKPAAALKHKIVLPPEKARPVVVPRFDKPPVIDGKLNDEVWQHAATFKDFYQ